jgi:hypothetical protein
MSARTKRRAAPEPSEPPDVAEPSSLNTLEQRVMAVAEQVGRIAGTARARTDGWLDQPKFRKQLARIRESAARLLDQVAALSSPQTAPAPPPTPPPSGRSGGKVDAPGKKHRKAPGPARGVKHSNEQVPKALAARRMRRVGHRH